MKLEVLPDAESVARRAAELVAAEARAAVAERGRFGFAVSGGSTPWKMLRALADEDVPWRDVHVFQVDERVAPAGDPDRNLTHLEESLLAHAPLAPDQVHAMGVEDSELELAAALYARAGGGEKDVGRFTDRGQLQQASLFGHVDGRTLERIGCLQGERSLALSAH